MKYSTHKTYYNNENIEVPSATTILQMLNKPTLVKWANIMGFKRIDTDKVLTKAGTIGSIVHDFIECLLKNVPFEYPDEHVLYTREVSVKAGSFTDWYMENKELIQYEFLEKSFSSKEFGGTVDFYGTFDGRKMILDFKTSNKLHASYLMQLGAYIMLLEENNHQVEAVGVIHIKETNTTLHIIERDDMNKYIDAFNKLKTFFHSWFETETDGITWSEYKWKK